MNLIEEYGSYKSAMDELKVLESSNWAVDHAYSHELKNKMLEYRRQHNIFEVGDKVLRNDMEQDAIFTIVEKSTLNDREIIYCSINDVDYCFYSDILRHATDAEIKAGRRL